MATAQPPPGQPNAIKITLHPQVHPNPLPVPYTGLHSLVTKYRGAAPRSAVAEGDVEKVTDVKGTYILSDHEITYNGTDSGQSVVSVVVGTKLTTWILDSANDAVVQGPITLKGKEVKIRPKVPKA